MTNATFWGKGANWATVMGDSMGSTRTTDSLLRVPVVAAGGIADARGVSAALELGAAGVQVGTTYLLWPETMTAAAYRAALKSESVRHTALTNVFTGRPARAIVNRLVREIGPMNPAAPEFPLASSAVMPLRVKAEAQGRTDFFLVLVGSKCQRMQGNACCRADWATGGRHQVSFARRMFRLAGDSTDGSREIASGST
jgi:NAD(P)H-dependent flavin oxidoreductase YrpB (nitropropane dioxygenase family)